MISADHFWWLALALIVDAAIGDPDFIWRRIPHPAAVIGWTIAGLDRVLNQRSSPSAARYFLGIVSIAAVVAAAATIGYFAERGFAHLRFGWIGIVLIAGVFLAGRSLYDHVAAVAKALRNGGLEAGRSAVSRIVGRDPASLDESRICRAAIESTAENFSDGVVAPAFWFLLFGLPGLFAYKAINTADSMIGHLTEHHRAFGWASARLDDLVNLPASRIAGLLLAFAAPFAGGSTTKSVRLMLTDASRHRSPNAGWPEAAMAGALGLALAGPRRYGGIIVSDPFLNEAGRREARPDDIDRALSVYVVANAFLFALVGLAAFGIWLFR